MNPLIGAVIGFIVIIASAIIVVNSINPIIDEGRGTASFNNAKEVMSSLDSAIRELMYEESGAKRSIKVDTRSGEFIISGDTDEIKFEMENTIKLYEQGTRFKEGNMLITSGPQMRAYEEDSAGTTNLILENDNVLFSIKKLGNSTNLVSIDTKDMISLIKNKNSNVESVPISGIFIDNANDVGQGYTQLTQKGDGLLSSSIKVVVNASIYYEAFFTLTTGSDFIELDIRKVTENE